MRIVKIFVTIQRKKHKSSKKRLDRVFLRKSKKRPCMSTLYISATRASDSAI